ncbi:MAG TPA: phenylalanine--tRNA ligase subunit beta [Bryobacteraceae bacterium]|jgi:phenylalanyl-tRNA synthetase beta chain|nr:phenylalanine--tRNA ligase subunit beta [Bryobacteraceae bacterium]
MKFSYSWLQELVDGLHESPKELMHLITLKTAECEGLEQTGLMLAEACEARIVTVEPLGKNVKTVVATANYGIKTVVCGAANCRPGLRTVYVPLGKKVIEGIESDGMLASTSELGINRDHSGIVELKENLILKPDWIVEVDNKSLTHRPDLWGHYGMAREVAAITGKKLIDPVHETLTVDPQVKVTIEDYSLCPRYSALVFENVTVQESPLWLQYRLEAIGLNPISNIVDVTNFVMAELAQPMHAFDADKLHDRQIIVRPAHAGEKLAALNGETYELDPSNLVIADPKGAVALAGVIGGAGSAISSATTRIVLESACFSASSIRKTSSKLKLRTDASMRFEKSQDPVNTVRGLARALELLKEVSPGIRLVGGLADAYQPLKPLEPIYLPLDWLNRKLGCEVLPAEVRRILESLQFEVDESFTVTVPSWRATKDISIKEDLVEEIGRMIGYDNITPVAPLSPARVPPGNPERVFHHKVREMAAAQGFTEVYNYSFVTEESARAFGFNPAELVQTDQNYLRPSLLPGILKNIEDNSRHFDHFRFFEIGNEIHMDHETPHFVAVIFSKETEILELKRLAECLLPGVQVRPTTARSYEHPQRAALVGNIGRLFEFHPKLVENGRAAVLDLNLNLLNQPHEVRYQPLRRFPESSFDLSFIVPERTLISEVKAAVPELPEILSVEFLREFKLPDAQRSLTYRFTLGAADRTLTSEEVSAIREKILSAVGFRSTL